MSRYIKSSNGDLIVMEVKLLPKKYVFIDLYSINLGGGSKAILFFLCLLPG